MVENQSLCEKWPYTNNAMSFFQRLFGNFTSPKIRPRKLFSCRPASYSAAVQGSSAAIQGCLPAVQGSWTTSWAAAEQLAGSNFWRSKITKKTFFFYSQTTFCKKDIAIFLYGHFSPLNPFKEHNQNMYTP